MIRFIFCFSVVTLTLNFPSVSTLPYATGIPPIAKTVYYYAVQHDNIQVATSYQICDETGFWFDKQEKCRTAYRYKLVPKTKRVLRTRTTYVCEHGYEAINDECHYIINRKSTEGTKSSNDNETLTIAISIPGIISFIIFVCCICACYRSF